MTKGSNQAKINPEINDATFLGQTFSASNLRPEISDKVLTAIERRKTIYFNDHKMAHCFKSCPLFKPAIGDPTRDQKKNHLILS